MQINSSHDKIIEYFDEFWPNLFFDYHRILCVNFIGAWLLSNGKKSKYWNKNKVSFSYSTFSFYLSSIYIMLPSLICFCNFIACGDSLETIVDAPSDKQIHLGRVQLSDGQTYTSCRNLCKKNYPEFEFYHKFNLYQSCDCIKLYSGDQIKLRAHGAYTFGYASACGNILKDIHKH